jgi:Raf kinase inhibitor-like YbhB/YbcL family protein
MNFNLKSDAFNEGELIPSRFTCDGENISPPLTWEYFPSSVKSFAILVEDPDAPGGLFVHWVIFNIPKEINSFPENVTKKNFPDVVQGSNHFGDNGYGGPCPPRGSHRYFFKIYALDTFIKLDSKAGRRDILREMEGHILAQTELMGKYERKI